MSGNGIRCFAQALARRRGDLGEQTILTDAGPRAHRGAPDRGPADDPRHRRHGRGRRAARAARVGRHRHQPRPPRRPPRPRQPAHRGRPSTTSPPSTSSPSVARSRHQPRDHRARARARRHHDARPRARRRHHRGVRHRRLRGGLGGRPTGASSTARAGNSTVHMDGGDARVALHVPEPGRVTLTGPATFVAHDRDPTPMSNPYNEALGATLIERTDPRAHRASSASRSPATDDETPTPASTSSRRWSTPPAPTSSPAWCSAAITPITRGSSARARPRSCTSCASRSTPTPSCSTTS